MTSYLFGLVFVIFVCSQSTNGLKFNKEDESCPELYEAVGCFKDQRNDRAMSKLVLTDRDHTSPVYSQRRIGWGNFPVYLKSLACRCAKKSKELGYSYFGLQFYGECHSGENAEFSFDKHGESDECTQGTYGLCEDAENEECVGKANANFVYKIKQEGDGSGVDHGPLDA